MKLIKYYLMVVFCLLSIDVIAGGTEGVKVPIDTLCHCVNDCDRKQKCEWIWSEYAFMSIDDNLEDEGRAILKRQKLSLLEMVDSGDFGCFTSFGLYKGRFIRTDVEITKSEVTKILQEKVSSIPSLKDRKKSDSDDLCLFKFD